MADDLSGRLIGTYRIVRKLGEGGMGVVYKAHEESLNRPVALKILPASLAADAAFLKRFDREAKAAAQLSHPNVVTVYNVGREGDLHFISMEYVKGRELYGMIQDAGQMEVTDALRIVRQVADALDAAHQAGIVHRDIKPQNIMVDTVARVKVMDFGIARIAEKHQTSKLTKTGEVLGTVAYMSPEQCSEEVIDGRSDIFSLGVVLYHMLTGRLPFEAETVVGVIMKILSEAPPAVQGLNSSVPDEVARMISRAMAKKPDDRYPTCAAWVQEIDAVLHGNLAGAVLSQPAARPPGPGGLPSRYAPEDEGTEYRYDPSGYSAGPGGGYGARQESGRGFMTKLLLMMVALGLFLGVGAVMVVAINTMSDPGPDADEEIVIGLDAAPGAPPRPRPAEPDPEPEEDEPPVRQPRGGVSLPPGVDAEALREMRGLLRDAGDQAHKAQLRSRANMLRAMLEAEPDNDALRAELEEIQEELKP